MGPSELSEHQEKTVSPDHQAGQGDCGGDSDDTNTITTNESETPPSSRRRRASARSRRTSGEESSINATTSDEASTPSRASRRREKRRQMRANRATRTPTGMASSDESCSESESDTLGSLPPCTTTTISNRLSLVGEDFRDLGPAENVVPDHIPPECTPGAFYHLGRAFGELPEWARNNSNRRLCGSGQRRSSTRRSASSSSSSSPGQRNARGSVNSSSPGLVRGNVLAARASSLIPPPPFFGRSGSEWCLNSRTSCVGRARRRSSRLRGSIISLFRRTSSGLPEAEPLHAEKVVYAVVQQDEEEPAFWSWELVIFSLLILFLGIAIGRYTAPDAH